MGRIRCCKHSPTLHFVGFNPFGMMRFFGFISILLTSFFLTRSPDIISTSISYYLEIWWNLWSSYNQNISIHMVLGSHQSCWQQHRYATQQCERFSVWGIVTVLPADATKQCHNSVESSSSTIAMAAGNVICTSYNMAPFKNSMINSTSQFKWSSWPGPWNWHNAAE